MSIAFRRAHETLASNHHRDGGNRPRGLDRHERWRGRPRAGAGARAIARAWAALARQSRSRSAHAAAGWARRSGTHANSSANTDTWTRSRHRQHQRRRRQRWTARPGWWRRNARVLTALKVPPPRVAGQLAGVKSEPVHSPPGELASVGAQTATPGNTQAMAGHRPTGLLQPNICHCARIWVSFVASLT